MSSKPIFAASFARKFVAILSALAMTLAVFIVQDALTTQRANAANAADFKPGDIISDAVFYNGNAMSAAGVQSFLNSKMPNCLINNGDPKYAAGAYIPEHKSNVASACLNAYRTETQTLDADHLCSGYAGAASESAASISYKVGKACGVSQKVLLVMLEKEQSLISDRWPNIRQYATALGFNCPDTAPCSAATAGFFKQVYAAGRQLRNYLTYPANWGHYTDGTESAYEIWTAGAWNTIAYHPRTYDSPPGCVTKRVYIENHATRALYIYTPYTPNETAMSNIYGSQDDGCSAYGNRNFGVCLPIGSAPPVVLM